ncbi:hypothetical protein ACTFIY_006969 [Dictyostelium cf. discoideum]
MEQEYYTSSKFGSPSVSQLLALIMAAIVGPTILIFILFVVYKQISQFRLFKNLNKSLERRSIKINNLGNHAVEIVYFQQTPNDSYSETSSLLNNNIILV